uniref:Uncharacterized protein n=1 Tax=Arundo donax TaxID=35708 RepID=A0A0A8Z3R5_ARUDO
MLDANCHIQTSGIIKQAGKILTLTDLELVKIKDTSGMTYSNSY